MEGEINFEELKKFISESRRNTYAGEGGLIEKPFLEGSHQLEYKEGKYFYRDIFFSGKENFIGQEVVYFNDSPIWSMVYSGSAEPKETTPFLKKSLSILSDKCRFNENCEFNENDFRYKNKGEGRIEQFGGEEQIFLKDISVYKLNYHGGLVSK